MMKSTINFKIVITPAVVPASRSSFFASDSDKLISKMKKKNTFRKKHFKEREFKILKKYGSTGA